MSKVERPTSISSQIWGSQPNETTSLLDSHSTALPASPPPPRIKASVLKCVLVAAAVQLLLSVGRYVALVPSTAILQDIICGDYYALHTGTVASPDIDRCKVAPVQSEVAYILGWQGALENIPAMLLAVPFGALADRIGRKKVLLLAIFGLVMNDFWIRLVCECNWFDDFFPIRMLWLSGLWQVFGAGAATLSSLTFVLVADACPAEQRTTAFSQIKSARLFSRIIFVPLGGALIPISPWIPMLISSGFMVVGFAVALIWVLETLPSTSSRNQGSEESTGQIPNEDNTKMSLHLRLQESVASITKLVMKNTRVIVLVLSFFVFQLGEQAGGGILLLYASRLGWSLSKASYLISIRAGINMAVLAVLVPAISYVLIRHLHLSVMAKDKHIAQASGIFLILGSSAIFLATSPVTIVVGQILASLCDVFVLPVRSLTTSMVEQNHLAILYTVIEVLTNGGMIIGHPLLAASFGWGMQLGEFWIGLPFLIAAGCFLLALLAVSTAPVKDKGGDSQRLMKSGDIWRAK